MSRKIPRALTVAGSDPSGGAGIQADLRTFGAIGVFGAAAISAITVQDTRRVHSVEPLAAKLVAAQIDAVLEDLRPDAVKTGMLANRAIVDAAARAFASAAVARLVVDPVMRSTSGAALLDGAGIRSLRERLLPLARVVTPNVGEAEILAGMEIRDVRAAEEACRRILALGPRAVVVKGGHLAGDPIDVLGTARGIRRFAGKRRARGAHGTGCVFSAAIAAHLAHRETLEDAVAAAKRFVDRLLRSAPRVGGGRPVLLPGPLLRGMSRELSSRAR